LFHDAFARDLGLRQQGNFNSSAFQNRDRPILEVSLPLWKTQASLR
jgi:hypothetical protein